MVQLKQKDFAIIGCGWLGRPMAMALRTLSESIITSTKTLNSSIELSKLAIDYVLFDAYSSVNFPQVLAAKTVIILIPPSSAEGEQSYANAIQSIASSCMELGTQKVILSSSTSVYHGESGIYAEDGMLSESERSKQLLEAEKAILQSKNGLILRLGGLINGQRNPSIFGLKSKLPGNEPINMIHQKDAVHACLFLIQSEAMGIFNVVAPEHPDRSAFYNAAFKQNHQEEVEFINTPFPNNRIITSEKLEALGYTFIHPNPLTFPMKLA